MNPILSVEHLTAGYDRTGLVFDDFSFRLERGECLCLHGPSGCGKSTAVWAILGVLEKRGGFARGSIFYYKKEEKLQLLPHDEKIMRELRWKEIALVPQSSMNSFHPVYTIRKTMKEMLELGAEKMTKGQIEARCGELLEMVQLPHSVLDAYPHELSGGMKQRSAIALALLLNPRLLILDEATTGLDVIVEADILWLLKKLRKEKDVSMLFISHDDRISDAFCDRRLEVLGGKGR